MDCQLTANLPSALSILYSHVMRVFNHLILSVPTTQDWYRGNVGMCIRPEIRGSGDPSMAGDVNCQCYLISPVWSRSRAVCRGPLEIASQIALYCKNSAHCGILVSQAILSYKTLYCKNRGHCGIVVSQAMPSQIELYWKKRDDCGIVVYWYLRLYHLK